MLGRNHELFARAEGAYDRAIALIRSMDETFQRAAFREEGQARYDTRITLYQFDLILQAILLNMALIDGNFHRLERRLIQRITDYGDLTVYLRREGSFGPELSWDSLAALAAPEQRRLLEQLPDVLEQTCRSFVQPLALVDASERSVDFLEQLEGELGEIAGSLSDVDGVPRSEEMTAYVHMQEHLLTRRWREIKAGA